MKIQTFGLLGATLLLAFMTGCSTLNSLGWSSSKSSNNEVKSAEQTKMDAMVRADAAAKADAQAKAEAKVKAKAEEAKAKEEAKIKAEIEAKVKAALEAKTKEEAEAKAKIPRCGEDLIKAFIANDADAFLALLPEVVSQEFGKNGFNKTVESMKDQLGTPISYEFMFNLEHPKFTVSIWKVRFERDNTDRTKKIYQETLFRAVSGEIDGQEKLLMFNFF